MKFLSIFLFLVTVTNVTISFADPILHIDVDCDADQPGVLAAAVTGAVPGTTIFVTGTCQDALLINTDDLTLIGNEGSNKAIITGPFPQDRILIDGAARTSIIGFTIEKGLVGIASSNNASFTLVDVDIRNNIFGIEITQSSSAIFSGTVTVSNNNVFGLQVLTGATLVVEESAQLILEKNFLGAQVSINSTFFAESDALIIAKNNESIGFSVNTGSTGFLFNATLHAHDNGLDGFDVVSAANFDADGNSEIKSDNNGRDGISIDNSTLNLFGFFSSEAGFPKIIANGNVRNGVLVELTSKLDIGRNSSIEARNNGGAGVNLDDGSSARLQRSVMVDNNGDLSNHGDSDDSDESEHTDSGLADVVVTFGSRVSFNQSADNAGEVTPNQISLALCDSSSLSRGDVECDD